MSRSIQYSLNLVLNVLSEFAIDAVNKSSIIFQILSKKIFELSLYYLGPFKTTFMLVSTLYYWPTEKQSGK